MKGNARTDRRWPLSGRVGASVGRVGASVGRVGVSVGRVGAVNQRMGGQGGSQALGGSWTAARPPSRSRARGDPDNGARKPEGVPKSIRGRTQRQRLSLPWEP